MNPRNGKIARLPHDVREELNERLERSEPGPQLLDWLNALPEVKLVVQSAFSGMPVSKQNLSEWRLGGFQEWLDRRESSKSLRTNEMESKSGQIRPGLVTVSRSESHRSEGKGRGVTFRFKIGNKLENVVIILDGRFA